MSIVAVSVSPPVARAAASAIWLMNLSPFLTAAKSYALGTSIKRRRGTPMRIAEAHVTLGLWPPIRRPRHRSWAWTGCTPRSAQAGRACQTDTGCD